MTSATDPSADEGRRERGKRERRERILGAARDLFAERGFSAVTTKAIADAADVGEGTVFRHFPTKGDLLAAVMNERLERGAEDGIRLAESGTDAVDAILALLRPLADASLEHPENTLAFQRETLFGELTEGPVATARVAALEAAVRRILAAHAARHPVRDDVDLDDAAHAIYATVFVDVVRASLGRTAAEDLPQRVRRSVAFLLRALLDPPR